MDIPVESPLASGKQLTALGAYAGLSAYAVSTSFLWNSVHPLLLPIIVLQLAGEEAKNSALGLITFVGLLVAMVLQPMAGSLSDSTGTRWGRRRPFIVAGTAAGAVFFLGLGLVDSLLTVLAVYVAMQIVFNFGSAAYQGLIPDLVPPNRRGVASGAKNFAEVLGLILAAVVLPSLVTEQDLSAGFVVVGAVLVAGTAITCLVTREQPALTLHSPHPHGPHPNPLPAGRGDTALTLALSHEGVGTEVEGRGDVGSARNAIHTMLSAFAVSPRRHTDFFWMVAGRLLFVLAMASVQSFSLFYVRDVLKPDDALGLWRDLTASIGLSILVVSYPAGLLADRIGRKPVILGAGAIASCGALLMLTANDSSSVLLFGTLVGIGIGLFLSSNWALATDLIPPAEGARFLGLTNLATAGGAALARLNGPVIDAVNAVQPLLGYRLMLLFVGLAFAAGGLLVLKVRVRAVDGGEVSSPGPK